MRVGLFGGTFDPIHQGHLILAEFCREACSLDKVVFVVAGEPPHKGRPRTAARHRLEMVELAIAGNDAFEATDIEISRPGPHYTYETLELTTAARPGDELFFIIGADSLADLPGWRRPERIFELATIVVVNRPGIDSQLISQFSPPEGAQPIIQVPMPDIGIASRSLRSRLAESKSIRYMVPRAVEMYLRHHRLYDATPE
ncbi:MAG: nicotinate-nucleotide adenylyltransferase [Isosphaeraceae bacterium]